MKKYDIVDCFLFCIIGGCIGAIIAICIYHSDISASSAIEKGYFEYEKVIYAVTPFDTLETPKKTK